MQTCPTCNAVNNADSKFCFSCGNPLGEGSVQAQQPSQPNEPIQPQQPSQLYQPAQPAQQYQPTQPQQPYQPMQPQQPSQPYPPAQPVQSQQQYPPYQQNSGQYTVPSYVTPAKKSNSIWVIVGSGIVTLAAIVFLIIKFTSLGSSVLGMFGLGKSNQFLEYYNEIHSPLYASEYAIIDELNRTVLTNENPDWELIYQKAPTWKRGIDDVKRGYTNAKVANEVIQEVNVLSTQRNIVMELAIAELINAIEQDNINIYNEDFIPNINKYSTLYEEWDAKVNELFDKYGLTLSGN